MTFQKPSPFLGRNGHGCGRFGGACGDRTHVYSEAGTDMGLEKPSPFLGRNGDGRGRFWAGMYPHLFLPRIGHGFPETHVQSLVGTEMGANAPTAPAAN